TRVSETVVNSTKELKYGTPVEIHVDVHPGSSYIFNITNEEDHKPTGEIQVNVTMCQPREADSEPVERSESGLFDIPAEKVKEMIKTYCSDKSRVKRSPGNGKYKMYLFITGTNEKSADKNISVVGISTHAEVPGTSATHTSPSTTTPPSSSPTSPPPTPTHTPTHASTAAPTTPAASSLSTGWIVGMVLIAIFVVTLIIAIAIFIYFYMKRRRGSINEDRDGLFNGQQFVDESPSRNLPFPKTVNNYQTPQTSSTIPAVNNYSSSQPYNYPQPSSNYPKLMHPNIQSPQPNIASPINPITPNNNLYGSRGLSRNY
ncbi:unnamed protein product, partial [Anisakis simplex]|uniref:SEA domain-containing protein n=1 Tax=Anisakis simplex TaxID=6269 RepID=A0A0M3KJC4_ANISI